MPVEDTVGDCVGIAVGVYNIEIEGAGYYFFYRIEFFNDHVIVTHLVCKEFYPVLVTTGHEEVAPEVLFLARRAQVITLARNQLYAIEGYANSATFTIGFKFIGEKLESF